MTKCASASFLQSLAALLRPPVRLALRHALSFQDFQELLRRTYFEVASEELAARGEKVNVSRLSAATGLQRREVMRLQSEEQELSPSQSVASRVIGQWLLHKSYRSPQGKPKTLTVDGAESEFAHLVRSITNDIHPGTVLFELERLGAVVRTKAGVKLVASAYVPKGDTVAQYELLAADATDLFQAVEENIHGQADVPNVHAKTQFDNVYPEDISKIREWFLKRSREIHHEVREYLGKCDADTSPRQPRRNGGARVAFATFSITELPADGDEGRNEEKAK